jgi:predicted ester cyclase
MSGMSNAKVVRSVIEQGFNRGNFAALDDLFQAGYAEHQFGLPADLEGFKKELRELRAAFPDLHLNIEDLIEHEDMVWIRLTASGTHTGPFMHRAPTGRSFRINVLDVLRLKDGKIVEHWGVADRFALMWQLALLPQAQAQPA